MNGEIEEERKKKTKKTGFFFSFPVKKNIQWEGIC